MKSAVVVTLALLSVVLVAAPAVAGLYVMPVSALDDFAGRINPDDLSAARFVIDLGGVSITESEWCPDTPATYAVFNVQASYFLFGPLRDGDQYEQIAAVLAALREDLDARLVAETGRKVFANAYIYPLHFPAGSCLKEGGFGQGTVVGKGASSVFSDGLTILNLTLDKLDELERKTDTGKAGDSEWKRTEDALDELRGRLVKGTENLRGLDFMGAFGKGGEHLTPQDVVDFGGVVKASGILELGRQSEGKASERSKPEVEHGEGNGNGGSGILPGGFSSWFVTFLELVAEYFGIRELAAQTLVFLYMLAPDLFEQVAFFLSDIQHALTIDSLDKFLDKFSYIIDKAMEVWEAGRNLQQLIEKGGVEAFESALRGLDGYVEVLELDRVLPAEAVKYAKLFGELGTLDRDQFLDRIYDLGEKRLIDELEKRVADVPGLDRLDFGALVGALKEDKLEDYVKEELRRQAVGAVPADFQKAADLILAGDTESAVEEGFSALLDKYGGRRIGLPTRELIGHLKQGDKEKALACIVKSQSRRAGKYAPALDAMADRNLPEALGCTIEAMTDGKLDETWRRALADLPRTGVEGMLANRLGELGFGEIDGETLRRFFSDGFDDPAVADLVRKAARSAGREWLAFADTASIRELRERLEATLVPVARALELGDGRLSLSPDLWGAMPWLEAVEQLARAGEAATANLGDWTAGSWRGLAADELQYARTRVLAWADAAHEGVGGARDALDAFDGGRLLAHLDRRIADGDISGAWIDAARFLVRSPGEEPGLRRLAEVILDGGAASAGDIDRMLAELGLTPLEAVRELARLFPTLGAPELWWTQMAARSRVTDTEALRVSLDRISDGRIGRLADVCTDRDATIAYLRQELGIPDGATADPEVVDEMIRTWLRKAGLTPEEFLNDVSADGFHSAVGDCFRSRLSDDGRRASRVADTMMAAKMKSLEVLAEMVRKRLDPAQLRQYELQAAVRR
jgi:hypothetical protein